MSNEIAIADEKKLAVYGGLMDETEVSGQDILMPTLLLMQPLSKLVTDDKAKTGEWRGSLSENLLAEKGKTVEVIPFGFHKTWIVFKDGISGQKRPEFVAVEPYSNRPQRERIENINGIQFHNFETINYFVMPVAEINLKTAIPYLLRFRSTGFIVGKKMETMRAMLQKANKPHCFSTFQLGSVLKENDQGKFFVPTLDWGRDTTEAELAVVKPWVELARAGKAKADDADLRGDDTSAPTAGATVDVEHSGDQKFEC